MFLGWLKIRLDKTGRFNWHSSFKMDVKAMYPSKAIAHRRSHGFRGKGSSRYLLRMGRDKTKEERQTVKEREWRRKQPAPHWCVTAKAAAPGASARCRRRLGGQAGHRCCSLWCRARAAQQQQPLLRPPPAPFPCKSTSELLLGEAGREMPHAWFSLHSAEQDLIQPTAPRQAASKATPPTASPVTYNFQSWLPTCIKGGKIVPPDTLFYQSTPAT